MWFRVASLTTLVSIAYADNGNGADKSAGGSMRNIHPSLPSFALSPSSIKMKKQPPSIDELELELDLPNPIEFCGTSLDILNGACSSEEDVCVHVKEQGTESSRTETYGICLSRSLAETYHFQPVYYDDAALYIEKDDHRLLIQNDCDTDCIDIGRYEVTVTGEEFRDLIKSCYLDTDACPDDASVISCWDTSKVDNMDEAFLDYINFNEPLRCFDTSRVTSMARMFAYSDAFNQPIGTWNVAKVTSMAEMFWHALAFNQPIGTWNVAKVNSMERMFYIAKDFNQPIDEWNVSSVTSMDRMFRSAFDFNKPIGTWNVAKVTSMKKMFQAAKDFNQPIDEWNVSSVTSMADIFFVAVTFNQCLSTWASKSSSFLATTHMLTLSGCPNKSYTDPNVAPWCQIESDECRAPIAFPSTTPSELPGTTPSYLPSSAPSDAVPFSPSSLPSKSSPTESPTVGCAAYNGKRKKCKNENGCFWKRKGKLCKPCEKIKKKRRCNKKENCAWNKMNKMCVSK